MEAKVLRRESTLTLAGPSPTPSELADGVRNPAPRHESTKQLEDPSDESGEEPSDGYESEA